jgi:phospholipase C
MSTTDRRDFLRVLTGITVAGALPQSIGRALALPANHRTGTIRDVEHIVILTQENRSFDHYFGSLRGVRGFGDPRPVVLPSGKSVWHQPNGAAEVLPFHPTASNLGLQFLNGTPHGWNDAHGAWNGGKYDQWIKYKSTTTMAYLTREDIPFHYALADAFTICDDYHCSAMTPTDPNRYFMWTGWTGNDGQGGGPVISNAEAGYDWSTFPELLEKVGVSWKIYQDIGTGLDASGYWGWTDNPYIGNYGDNSLLYFHQYQNAQVGTPLYDKAKTGTNILNGGTLFDKLRADVAGNTLPQVSWIAAPEAYCEHPNFPANYGAWYISQVLDALTSNPEVWSKTALFINYDENDGFFDHIVPPSPPQSVEQGKSTVDVSIEIFQGSATYPATSYPVGPYGLGARVPMIVVSPWSKGGYVCSEVFDHTSLIQFIEKRFGPDHPGLFEKQISPWRRAICGDLTSAFNFAEPDAKVVALPDTSAFQPPAADILSAKRYPSYVPAVPTTQTMPVQEDGLRPARPLPYELNVDGEADFSKHAFNIGFRNTGNAGACFHVRSGNTSAGPWTYTVEAGKSLSDTWNVASNANGEYDLSVYGPNGFLRAFKGGTGAGRANLDVESRYGDEGAGLELTVTNRGVAACTVSIVNSYTNEAFTHWLDRGQSVTKQWSLERNHGWYDLVIHVNTDQGFEQRLAGHIETGEDSASDPGIGSGADRLADRD